VDRVDIQPSAGTPVIKIGDILAGKYRVERVLGQGGMGVVVAARHEQLGFPVALKFMLPVAVGDPALKERFLREARAAGSLRGEHVARVMDFGTLDDGSPYIVMEFLQGSDLGEMLERVGPLPPHEAALYVLQACKAMEEAHAQGIVHRDLKPQNLFLTRRPDGSPLVKVLDFGISKLVGNEPSLSVTSSSAMMGSPLYMAPEQVRSAKKVDARADIYSLGVILYQLVTGRVPFPAETLGELFEALFTRATPPPRGHRPEISPELDAVIMRCLAKTPEERFEGAAQLGAALQPLTDPRRSLTSMPAVEAAPAPLGTPVLPATPNANATPNATPGLAAPAATQASPGIGLGPTTTSGAVSEARPEIPGVPRRGARIVWLAGAFAVVAAGVVGVVVMRGRSPEAATSATSAPTGSAPASAAPSPSAAPVPSPASPSPSSPPLASAALAPLATTGASSAAPGAPPVAAAPATGPSRGGAAPAAPGRSHPGPASAPSSAAGGSPRPAPAKPANADPFGSPD
jgi:serine/threonine protein kinase